MEKMQQFISNIVKNEKKTYGRKSIFKVVYLRSVTQFQYILEKNDHGGTLFGSWHGSTDSISKRFTGTLP